MNKVLNIVGKPQSKSEQEFMSAYEILKNQFGEVTYETDAKQIHIRIDQAMATYDFNSRTVFSEDDALRQRVNNFLERAEASIFAIKESLHVEV
jgi:hypothetical protein